jgi:hypothetical protein
VSPAGAEQVQVMAHRTQASSASDAVGLYEAESRGRATLIGGQRMPGPSRPDSVRLASPRRDSSGAPPALTAADRRSPPRRPLNPAPALRDRRPSQGR